MSIAVDWLAKRAALSPNKLALIDTIRERRITYREWNEQANRTARMLVDELGIQPGERVAVLATNSVEYLDLLFACNKTGAVLQNLNWRLAAPELELLLEHAQPRALFYSTDLSEKVRQLKLRGDLDAMNACVALDGGERAAPRDRTISERETLSAAPLPEAELQLSDPWVICYTGGSTGLPKGVVLSYGNVEWNAINTVMTWGLCDTDTAVLDASLFHIGGLNVLTTPLIQAGGTNIVCKSFDTDQAFDLLDGGQATVYFNVPTAFIRMQQHPRWKEANFRSLRFVISGGAPCPAPVFERFWEKSVDFRTGYGLTEAGPNTFWLPSKQIRQKPGAVGYPLFHIEVKLLNVTGGEVTQPDQPGELLIRGPHRTTGYWNNPMATAQFIDDEGWLHTGDLAHFDEDGAFTIIGRAKDMYISGGENVYPAVVESVLYGHPDVVEASVIGVPDAHWGEVGSAVLVLRPGSKTAEAELEAYLRERIAGYKVPKNYVFIDELPKTGAGKIDRRALRERYGELQG
ncbi:acyl-CoA synthetase [Alkalilimnicola sp. S0819]|uniref:acyl-CoA synthetase n=1 Tax=Alkalilimnicola sp. S0819 TaxID=2613922 RepID=UPI001261E5AF|nr:long-chain fatty acid--CoA ligase [Alkalilimnicola sp. S0819]KAB7628313.1 long-chain fatty acid--CoA ligase [Alkalilimnicola sp. S0819]MPQ15211.1 AMP-binding protein [Alkalilimnicola sp. S0819]